MKKEIPFLTTKDILKKRHRTTEGLIVANTTTVRVELIKLGLKSKENLAFPVDNLSAVVFFINTILNKSKR